MLALISNNWARESGTSWKSLCVMGFVMVPPVDSLDLGMLVFPRSRLFWPIVGFGLRQNPEETIGRWGGLFFVRSLADTDTPET